MTRVYHLPPVFYEDHRSRDLPEEGVSIQTGRRGQRAVVEMDDAAFRDLYGDASHYSDRQIAADMGLPGLAASARATLRALRKQNPDLVSTVVAEKEAQRRVWLRTP